MAEGFADVRDVYLGHVVTGDAGEVVVLAEPALLDAVFVAALHDGVLCELGHVDRAQLVDLRCDCVLFDQRLLGEGELKRVVG